LRVGILGGAFNPPHTGHLVGAQEALIQLELDKVIFIPVGQAPHRELQGDPGAEARLEMVELAIADDDRFEASRAELDREGPSYTADTLRDLGERSPGDELFLILGGDQAATLSTWHEPERVLSMATVAVLERSTWSRNAIGIKIGRLPGAERVRYLEMLVILISSSDIRRLV
jgi:nicotinate-nucleotide adenylyltransferase